MAVEKRGDWVVPAINPTHTATILKSPISLPNQMGWWNLPNGEGVIGDSVADIFDKALVRVCRAYPRDLKMCFVERSHSKTEAVEPIPSQNSWADWAIGTRHLRARQTPQHHFAHVKNRAILR